MRTRKREEEYSVSLPHICERKIDGAIHNCYERYLYAVILSCALFVVFLLSVQLISKVSFLRKMLISF